MEFPSIPAYEDGTFFDDSAVAAGGMGVARNSVGSARRMK
jgi:hypothetical protein